MSVDDNDVGRIVSQKALWHMKANRPDVPLHLLAFDGREVFCYCTKIHTYPGNVTACRITTKNNAPHACYSKQDQHYNRSLGYQIQGKAGD